ncbi:hypothetical protein [Microcystis phage Mae-JY09]
MSTLLPIVQNNQGGGMLLGAGDPRQTAAYSVEVAWPAMAGDAFRLGVSLLDGPDVLVDAFSVTFGDGPYDDLTAEPGHGVKSVRIRRGREDQLARMSMGECTIVVHDPDGLYNPRNESSPLYGQLLPMRQVRVRADNGPGPVHLFRGFIRSIEHDPRRDARETVINAVDLFVVLSRVSPALDVVGQTTTGECIGRILDEVGWTDPDLRSLDEGDTFEDFSADGSATALSLIEGLLEAERGQFFIDAAGIATYEERHTRPTRPVADTVADTMMAMRPGVDLDQVRNRARVTRQIGEVSGEPQFVADGASVAAYGPADFGDITTPYLESDAQAAQLAGYLAGLLAQPRSPVWGLEQINRDATTLTRIIDRELGDRVSVTDSLGSTSGDYLVEGITHDITDGGKYHRCSWTLSERGAQVFIVGQSVIAGPDRISY